MAHNVPGTRARRVQRQFPKAAEILELMTFKTPELVAGANAGPRDAAHPPCPGGSHRPRRRALTHLRHDGMIGTGGSALQKPFMPSSSCHLALASRNWTAQFRRPEIGYQWQQKGTAK
jgi:hypothetical protein